MGNIVNHIVSGADNTVELAHQTFLDDFRQALAIPFMGCFETDVAQLLIRTFDVRRIQLILDREDRFDLILEPVRVFDHDFPGFLFGDPVKGLQHFPRCQQILAWCRIHPAVIGIVFIERMP